MDAGILLCCSLLRIESGGSCQCVDQTIHRKGINLTTNLGKNVWETLLCTMLNTLASYRYVTTDYRRFIHLP